MALSTSGGKPGKGWACPSGLETPEFIGDKLVILMDFFPFNSTSWLSEDWAYQTIKYFRSFNKLMAHEGTTLRNYNYTGATTTKSNVQAWVNYAKEHIVGETFKNYLRLPFDKGIQELGALDQKRREKGEEFGTEVNFLYRGIYHQTKDEVKSIYFGDEVKVLIRAEKYSLLCGLVYKWAPSFSHQNFPGHWAEVAVENYMDAQKCNVILGTERQRDTKMLVHLFVWLGKKMATNSFQTRMRKTQLR